MKQKKKKRIFDTIFKLVVIIASIYFATYAWFVTFDRSEVEGYGVAISKTNNVVISTNGGESWSSTADLAIAADLQFNNEVTSDGLKFYKAGAKTVVGDPVTFIPATKNEDYLEFEVLFKTEASTYIFLDTESSVNPVAGATEEELLGSDVENQSGDGEFSRDLIAGAVRMAFIANDENGVTNNTSLVWAPNKNIELSLDSDDKYHASITSERVQEYKYIKVDNNGTFKEEDVPNIKDIISATNMGKGANGDPYLLKITVPEGESSAIGTLTVRVWVEGNDRDALTPLIGGEFKLKLFFTAITKEENNNVPDVTTNGSGIANFDSTMEYTADKGQTWISYSNNNNPEFSVGAEVWVRYKETGKAFASNYKVLNY